MNGLDQPRTFHVDSDECTGACVLIMRCLPASSLLGRLQY